MNNKASNSLIGAFVIGAMLLGVIGVVVFGSGKFLTKSYKSVMFFDGSVKGLQIGAPVMFRGVKIGQVTDIVLQVNAKNLTTIIPVYVEIDPHKMAQVEGDLSDIQRNIEAWIRKGLRGQLQPQSLITGQLMVDLDFYPGTPMRIVGLEKRYPEIPTIPSGLEQLAKKLEDLPLKEIADRLNETLAGINRLVNSHDLHASIGSLNRLLKNSDELVNDLRAEIGPLSSDMRATTASARAAFAQAEKTLRLEEGVPGQIAASIKETLSTADATLKETHTAVSNINGIATQNANLGYEIGRTLEQVGEVARSMRALADYLDRHPEALLRGKSPAGGK